MFSKKTAIVCAAVAALSFGMVASSDAATLSWAPDDNRGAGASVAVASPSIDADGSLQLSTTSANGDKVSVVFGTGSALGTLADLTSFTVDYYKVSGQGTPAASQFSYRLYLDNGTQLVWENNSNGNTTVPTDSWEHLNVGTGKFWQFVSSNAPGGDGIWHNFNAGGQYYDLTAWVNGQQVTGDTSGHATATSIVLDGSESIMGVGVAYGSSAGPILGYVDNIGLTFGGVTPTSYLGNIAVPEPSSLAIFLGLGGLALLSRRTRRKIA